MNKNPVIRTHPTFLMNSFMYDICFPLLALRIYVMDLSSGGAHHDSLMLLIISAMLNFNIINSIFIIYYSVNIRQIGIRIS